MTGRWRRTGSRRRQTSSSASAPAIPILRRHPSRPFNTRMRRSSTSTLAAFDSAKLDGGTSSADAKEALAAWRKNSRRRLHKQRLRGRITSPHSSKSETRNGPSYVTRRARRRPHRRPASLGVINDFIGPRDVIVAAGRQLPGDLHRLWRSTEPKRYHMEYGFSCMGYEVSGAFGVALAEPDREVYAFVGDGSYLMLHSELVTSLRNAGK